MDRKSDTILTQVKKNAEDLEDFKSTQFSGSDSVQIYLVSTTSAFDTSAVMGANERWVFYYQIFNPEAMTPEDASYDSGVVNIYVDTPPPGGARYQGLKSTTLSTGLGSPILFIGTNAIEFENGSYWSVTLRNIDSVSHTVYTKGFINTTLGSNVFFSYGAVLT